MSNYSINYFEFKDIDARGDKLNDGLYWLVDETSALEAIKRFINEYAAYEEGTLGREHYLSIKEANAEEPFGDVQVSAYRLDPESWEIHTYIETPNTYQDYSFVFTPEKTNK